MRNLLKYAPLEWRRCEEFCVPQGPSFSTAPRTTLKLSGSSLSFQAPRHSPRRKSVVQTRILPGHDVLISPELSSYAQGVMATPHWGINCLVRRLWAFYGPWMSGCKGELTFSICVIGRFDQHAFENLSFLNPKAFEMVVMYYLNDRYGHHNWGKELSHIPRFSGPQNWQSHDHLPVPSATFKIYRRGADPKRLVRPESLFVFPVTNSHFVEICFEHEVYSFDNDGSPTFDTSPMKELQGNIFNSISLELGSETQMFVDKVKERVGNIQMCKEFAPMKWPTNVYPPAPSGQMPEQHSLRAGN